MGGRITLLLEVGCPGRTPQREEEGGKGQETWLALWVMQGGDAAPEKPWGDLGRTVTSEVGRGGGPRQVALES